MAGQAGRRSFLGLVGATGAGVALSMTGFSESAIAAEPKFGSNPFQLGVASGDPMSDGVVLWTRLAVDPLAEDGSGGMPPETYPVRWEVAEDERFRRIAAHGRGFATPELGHSVHVEVGRLSPSREYFYRFRVGQQISPVGRTKTAPAVAERNNRLRFAYVSCQNFPDGFYTAYRHISKEDLDLVVHLGDYIYEGANQGGIGRGHLPAREILSLADYRVRYAQYKSDPDLQAAHATFPWVLTWDDHEVDNNYAGEIPENPDQQSPEQFMARRTAAYQAYYEALPLRRTSIPSGPDARIYRRLTYGRLAEFNVLDTRQYRDDQACGDGLQVPCDEARDPARSILGSEQEQWLHAGLGTSSTTWNVVAQQCVLGNADRDPGPGRLFPMDNWNGYEPARQRLFDAVVERDVENFVVLSGDAHCNMVTDLAANFDDPNSPVIGSEFLGTSVSSGQDGADMDVRGEEWLASNPHMSFYNQRRGYVRCDVTPDEWRSDYRVLPYVTSPGAPVSTLASFVVTEGRPGVETDSAPDSRV